MIIFRYLSKEVFATLLATTIVLLLVFMSNQFIHYLGQAASGSLPGRGVMQLMSLQVPLLLGYLLPLGLFLGILLVYGRLYADNEMTVLSSCGFSKWQLLRATLGFSALVMILVAGLMLWLEPKLAGYRDHIFAEAAAASPIETVYPGRFQSLADGKWIFYAANVSRNRQDLQDVFAAKVPEAAAPGAPPNPWVVVSAGGGHPWVDKTTGDKFLVLTQGYRYSGIPGYKNFQITSYRQYGERIENAQLHVRDEMEYTPTKQLLKLQHTNPQASAELQWRLAMPISTLVLALLAVPLSQVKPRKGRYAKILPSILLYVIYADLIFVAEASIAKGSLPAFPGMWWIHSGMLLLAVILIINFMGWRYLFKGLRGQTLAKNL